MTEANEQVYESERPSAGTDAGITASSAEEAKAEAKRRWGKADLFAGADEVDYYPMQAAGGAEVPLRRLTEGEWRKIEKMQSRGVKMHGAPDQDAQNRQAANGGMSMDIDIATSQEGEAQGKHLAVSKCFGGGGELTEEEVAAIPNPGLVDEMAEKIFEISGVSRGTQEEIKRVREE